MSQMAIERNSIWKLTEAEGLEDGLYRILEILPQLDCVILFKLSPSKKETKPKATLVSTFTSWVALATARASEFETPHYLLVAEEDIDEKSKLRRDNSYDLIKELLDDPEFIFSYSTLTRSPLLSDYARKNNISPKKIRRLLNIYWLYGQTKNALLPAFANSGARGKERQAKNSALGAPKSSLTQSFELNGKYILKQCDKDRIREALCKHYLKPSGLSLSQTYKEYLRTSFEKEIRTAQANNTTPAVPSFRQFSYLKDRLFSRQTVIKKRFTEKDYILRKRSVLGSPLQSLVVPGSCFEIDATVADIHIVSSFGKQYALGRPTVYSVIDRATQMVVGMHVSLYHASWRAARQALVNCFLPKAEYCAQYGIRIDESEWPCAHVPEKLVCDNGEMIGLEPQERVVPFTELSFAPAYRPDYKSFVERVFKTYNDQLLHHHLGTTRGGKVVRGDRDPRKDSIYTLDEVTTMLIGAALEHNNTVLQQLAYNNSLLLKNDLSPTPLNTWKIYLAEHRHALNRVDPSEVIARLLPPERVSMTRSGIKYKQMFYSCKQIEDENLASDARVNGRWQLEARIDDNTVNHLYVKISEKQGFTKCKLLPRSGMLKNMPVIEADLAQDWLKRQKEKAPVTTHSIDMRKRHVELTKKSTERAKDNAVPFREKIKNTRGNRQAELQRTTHNHPKKSSAEIGIEATKSNIIPILPRKNRTPEDK